MKYKQDFYTTKEKEIYDLFLEYLVPVMEDIKHTAFIKERIQNLDAAAYKKIYTKMKSYYQLRRKFIVMIKQILAKIIMESLNWLLFGDIIDSTLDRIEHDNI